MQKLKLQNKWDQSSNSFSKTEFELKESDKVITGKVSISSKQEGNFINKPLPFIVFKSKADAETQHAVKSGQPFNASFTLGVNQFKDNEGKIVKYHQIIINEARIEKLDKHNQAKANGYQLQEEIEDSEIPF